MIVSHSTHGRRNAPSRKRYYESTHGAARRLQLRSESSQRDTRPGQGRCRELSLSNSVKTANGTKRDIESTPVCADSSAGESSAKRVRQAYDGIVLEVQAENGAAPISVDGASGGKIVPEPLQYNHAKVKLEQPVEKLHRARALHYQSFTESQRKSPRESGGC